MSMLPPRLQRSVLRCPPGGLSLLGAARRGVALLPRLPRSALRGFTLIEILVSLAIVSIALLAGSQAVQALSRGAQRQSDVLLAQICAENELVKIRLSGQFPNTGDSSASCEQAGKVFTVAMEVRTTPNPNFRRLDTKVLDESTPILSIATIVGRN
jgi:general secretion pathway protein I